MIAGFDAKLVASADTPLTIGNVPSGMEALLLADMARAGTSVAYVMSDGQRVADLEQILGFVAPDIPVLTLPAWDCLPYDRVSPSADTSARRLAALAGLINHAKKPHPAVVLVTVNAMLQKMAPRDVIESLGFSARPGNQIRMEDIAARLERNGFDRVATVREVGEFAVRGGILDVFVPGTEEPVRLDFFGDTLESIRTFDPASQRTIAQARSLDLNPMSEVTLTPDTIGRFRKNYLSLFGAATRDDALYQAVSEGRRYAGMEHWLPLFYEQLETAFDYLKGFRIVTDHTAKEAAKERSKLVLDYYEARRASGETKGSTQGAPYKPVSPGQIYLDGKSFEAALASVNAVRLTPFNEHDSEGRPVATLDAHVGPRWARPPTEGDSEERVNVFDLAVKHIAERRAKGWKVLITGWSEGSLDRLLQVLNEHGLEKIKPVTSLKEVKKLGKGEAACAVLSLEAGFETGTLAVIGEQDILGDRMVRRSKRRKRGADFIAEVAGLDEGSLVVHAEHGIGRFVGLQTIEAAGAPRACLELHYADDAKLFLPVENIDLLSRYGSDAAEATLDKLGGGAWQMRKAKLKKRLLDMADELIRIAAARTGAYRTGRALRRICRAFPLRRNRGSVERDRSGPRRSRCRSADGSPHLRRCRFRQDRSGLARRLPCRHERRAGGGRRADDASGAAAFPHIFGALPWVADPGAAGLAACGFQGAGAYQKGSGGRKDRYRRRHPCAARRWHQLCQSRSSHHR